MKMKKMSLEKKVFISSKTNVFFLCPPKGGHLSIKAAPPGAVSYKVRKYPLHGTNGTAPLPRTILSSNSIIEM